MWTSSRPLARARRGIALGLIAVLLAQMPVLASPVALAAGCVVQNGNDAGADSLRAILADAACPTITFAPGVAEVVLASRLVVARDVTIQGNGAAATALRYAGVASDFGSVAWVRNGQVVFKGLTIRGGHTVINRGAGLIIDSSRGATSVTLDSVAVTGNVVDNNGGGGIYISNAALALVNTVVSDNIAHATPAPGWHSGGGLYIDDAAGSVSVTLTGSIVRNNEGYNGGGIFITGNGSNGTATLALVGSTVTANRASNDSGGIDADSATVTLDASTISANDASDTAGGLEIANGTLVATGSAVVGNIGHDGVGGIYATNATVTLTNVTVATNESRDDGGGGIRLADSTVTVTNSTISGNTSRDVGGGLYVVSSRATLRSTTIVGNSATDGGGGLYALGSTTQSGIIVVARSIVAGNVQGSAGSDCAVASSATAAILTEGDNLVGNATGCSAGGVGDLLLTAPLASAIDLALVGNGGPTPTHNVVPGGPAHDRIPVVRCGVTTDQRGVARPQGAGCDIGAVEYAAPPAPTPPPATPCGQRFGDVPAVDPACAAIEALNARGIINGCDPTAVPPLFCPTEGTKRAQMAALIVRAMPGWAGERYANTFTDRGPVDDELWGRVATLQHHGVVGGYPDCAAQGLAAPCYGPTDPVNRAQAISFVTRALVKKGYWAQQPTNAGLYGGALLGTGHEADASTYWYYTRARGGVPDYPEAGGFPTTEAAPRAWFARLLWAAIQGTPAAP